MQRHSILLLVLVVSMLFVLGIGADACVQLVWGPGDPLYGVPKASDDMSSWGQTSFCVGEMVYFQAFRYSTGTEEAPLLDRDTYGSSSFYDSVQYTWNVGDGTVYTGSSARHVFSAAGTYVVSLNVHDGGFFYDDPDRTEYLTITVSDCPGDVVYVRTDGDDSKSGYSWASAKKTIAAAMRVATSGKQVWVAHGTYAENVQLKAGVGLYGGFVGNEGDIDQRNWAVSANKTILQGDATTSVVSVESGAGSGTVISGFVITGGRSDHGGGIDCAGASPTVCDNVVMGCVATASGAGVYCSDSAALIHSNEIVANSAAAAGGGIASSGGSPSIINNTIVGNDAADGAGIDFFDSAPTIANNIIAFNSSGIRKTGTGEETLRTNCVYDNGDSDYSGLDMGTSDISQDPGLVNKDFGDFHTWGGSPCHDAGTDNLVGSAWLDIDAEVRVAGEHVDIGADEYGSTCPPVKYGVLSVTPTTDFVAGGPEGSIGLTNQVYTLRNEGDAPLEWTAVEALGWLDLDATTGTLLPEQSATVTVSLNAAANALDDGAYKGWVIFENSTTGSGNTSRAAALTVIDPGPGKLSVSENDGLTSCGFEGGPFDPTAKSYILTNTGSTSIGWTATNAQSWASVSNAGSSLASGQSVSVTVSINAIAKTLGVGTYSDAVTFANTTNGNGNTTRQVSLAVMPADAGDLVVTPYEPFEAVCALGGAATSTRTYSLKNAGKARLDWTADYDVPWIHLSSNAGPLYPGASTNVVVSFNSDARLLGAGVHHGQVSFRNETNGSGNTVRDVNLAVTCTGPGPLAISGPVLSDGSRPVDDTGRWLVKGPPGGTFVPESATYTLSNCGDVPISWSAQNTQAWATLSATSGTLSPGNTATVTVALTAGADSLDVGLYMDSISFQNLTNHTGDKAVDVDLWVLGYGAGPIAVKPLEAFDVSMWCGGPPIPGSRTYEVINLGDTDMEWSASRSETWTSLSAGRGTIECASSTNVTVRVNDLAKLLSVGNYSDTVQFVNETNNTGDTSIDVNLSVLGTDTGAIDVSPEDGFAASGPVGGSFAPASAQYTLTNTSGSSLAWTSCVREPWLSISSSGGTLAGGAYTQSVVSLNANATKLAPGFYSNSDGICFANVGVGLTNRYADLLVTTTGPGPLAVTGPEDFASHGELAGPFAPSSHEYTLTNCGDTAINWGAGKSQDWITLSQTQGILAGGASTTVSVSINSNANSLQAGLWTDNVYFANTTNYYPDSIAREVVLVVQKPGDGSLVITPNFDFTSNGSAGGEFSPSSKTYQLTNCGTNEIVWSASKTQPWTVLSASGGSLAPGESTEITVSFGAYAETLDAGTYSDTVSFVNLTSHQGDDTRDVELAISGNPTGAIVRVSEAGNDVNDGSSWAVAKKTIQSAIDQVTRTHGEIWVAAGKYNGAINIPPFVYVYGGFKGNETLRSARNWRNYTTILDGQLGASVVTFLGGYHFTGIDGFTIRNGNGVFDGENRYGGGVFCYDSSPTISHNIITGNAVPGGANTLGGGIYCFGGSPIIANNGITGNRVTGATQKGGGIYCSSSHAKIYNNTITSNTANAGGGGACFVDSDAEFTNNLVDQNTSGVLCEGSIAPIFDHNNVYELNSAYRYSGITEPTGDGNISANPNLRGDKIHVETSSACLNAGSNSVVRIGDLDIDHRDRKLNGVVDIGACEALACFPYTLSLTASANTMRVGNTITFAARVYNPYDVVCVEDYPVEINIDGGQLVSRTPENGRTGSDGVLTFTVMRGTAGTAQVTASIASLCNSTLKEDLTAEWRDGGDWPMFCHDAQHTGVAEDVGVDPGDLELMWTAALPTSSSAYSSHFWCDSGHRQPHNMWTMEHPMFDSSPAVVGNTLVVGTWDWNTKYLAGTTHGSVRAYNAETGALLWTTNEGGSMGGVASTPCIVDGSVYVGSADGYLYCIRLSDGYRVWRQPTTNRSGGSSKILASPVVHDGVVYVGNEAAKMYGFYACDGDPAWDPISLPINPDPVSGATFTTLQSNILGTSSPAVATVNGIDYLLFGCDDGRLYRLRLSDQNLTYIELGSCIESSPSVTGNTAYVGMSDFTRSVSTDQGLNIFKLSIEPLRVLDAGSAYREVRTTPALAFASAYMGDDFHECLHRFTQSDMTETTIPTYTAFLGSVSIASKHHAYSGDCTGKFYDFDPIEMKLNGDSMMLDTDIRSTPALSTNVDAAGNMWLFVTGKESTGTLYAFRGSNNSVVASPSFSVDGGAYYEQPSNVAITCATPGATIRYTTDGSDPSAVHGNVYSAPVPINGSMVLKAMAYMSGLGNSSIAAATYELIAYDPVFAPGSGTYTSVQSVAITCATSGTTIRYTLNGSEPTGTSMAYVAPISVVSSETIKAKAFRSGWTASRTKSAVYTITGTVATPSFSPGGGTYASSQNVSIYCSTPGATIRYTTNGTEPTATSPAYASPISVSTSLTLKAKAFKSGWTSSQTTTAFYAIRGDVATPTISPESGAYTSVQTVEISCATSGSSIHYTTDGTTPSDTVGTDYTAPFEVSEDTVVKAIGFMSGMNNSAVAEADYVITGKVATPTFTPDGNTYTSAQTVTMDCATIGATIHFTTDGTEPTEQSTAYSAPVSVTTTSLLRARAFKTDWEPSDIRYARYEIVLNRVEAPTFSPDGGNYSQAQSVVISTGTSGATIHYTTNGVEPTEQDAVYTQAVAVSSSTILKAQAFKTGWAPSPTSMAVYNFGNGPLTDDENTRAPGWAEDIIPTDGVDGADGGPSSADSVNLATGVGENRPDPDIRVYNPNGPEATYRRIYRSSFAENGICAPGLSPGWVDNYSMHITGSSSWGSLTLTYPNGARETLTPDLDGNNEPIVDGEGCAQIFAPAKAPYTAKGVPSATIPGKWDQITLKFRGKNKWTFGPSANPSTPNTYLVTQMGDAVGNPISIAYNSNDFLTQVADSSTGRALLQFSYSGGLLDKVYECNESSNPVREVVYAFSPSGTLSAVSMPRDCGASSACSQWEYGYSTGTPYLVTVAGPDPVASAGSTAMRSHPINYQSGHVSSLVDANGNERRYSYLGDKTVVSVYDANGNLVQSWTHKIGADGKDLGTIDALGHETTITYDADQVASVTNRNGQVTSYTYDSIGRLESTTSPGNLVTAFGYEASDPYLPTSVHTTGVSSGGAQAADLDYPATIITYDANQRPWVIYNPVPGTVGGTNRVPTTITYTFLGNVAIVTRPGPNDTETPVTTVYDYVSDPDMNYLTVERLNQPIRVTQYEGYPAANKVLSRVHYRYDDRGRVTHSIDADLNDTEVQYDSQGNVWKVIYPATYPSGGRAVAEYTYSPTGEVCTTRYRNENGAYLLGDDGIPVAVTYQRDNENRLVGEDGSGRGESMQLDALSRVKSITDGNQNTKWVEYDPVGNVRKWTQPLGQSVVLDYDDDGNVVRRTDGNNVTRNIGRRSVDSMVQDIGTYGDPGFVHYEYDELKRIVAMTDQTGTVTYEYDDCDNIKTATTVYKDSRGYNMAPQVLRYSYYPDGSRKELRTPIPVGVPGLVGSIRYSQSSQISGIKSWEATGSEIWVPWVGTPIRTFFDANGRITRQTTQGYKKNYSYTTRGLLRKAETWMGDVLAPIYGADTLQSSFNYMQYDAAGNLTEVTANIPANGRAADVSGKTNYYYDHRARLIEELRTLEDGSILYDNVQEYDGANNATSMRGVPLAYDANSQIASPGFGFDGNGLMTAYSVGDRSYSFDYEVDGTCNRIQRGGTQLNMGFRGDGLRAWKSVGGGSRTYFIYDNDVLLYEMDESGTVTTAYGNGPNGVTQCYYPDIDQYRVYAYDHLGSLVGFYRPCEPWNEPPTKGQSTMIFDSMGKLWADTSCSTGTNAYAHTPIQYLGQFGVYTDLETRYDGDDAVSLATDEFYDPVIGGYPSQQPGNWYDEPLDQTQMLLDVVGLIPVVGEPFDFASGIISGARGDYVGFSLSMGSMIPVIGDVTGAGKIARRAGKAAHLVEEADDVVHVIKDAERVGDAIHDVERAEGAAKRCLREPAAKSRAKWEAANGQKWPKEPNGRNYDVAHKRALADGGSNDVSNLEPMKHSDHMAHHKNNGDFARWARRRGKAR